MGGYKMDYEGDIFTSAKVCRARGWVDGWVGWGVGGVLILQGSEIIEVRHHGSELGSFQVIDDVGWGMKQQGWVIEWVGCGEGTHRIVNKGYLDPSDHRRESTVAPPGGVGASGVVGIRPGQGVPPRGYLISVEGRGGAYL
eukprot:765112-Hanusia_phi.AAC.2